MALPDPFKAIQRVLCKRFYQQQQQQQQQHQQQQQQQQQFFFFGGGGRWKSDEGMWVWCFVGVLLKQMFKLIDKDEQVVRLVNVFSVHHACIMPATRQTPWSLWDDYNVDLLYTKISLHLPTFNSKNTSNKWVDVTSSRDGFFPKGPILMGTLPDSTPKFQAKSVYTRKSYIFTVMYILYI